MNFIDHFLIHHQGKFRKRSSISYGAYEKENTIIVSGVAIRSVFFLLLILVSGNRKCRTKVERRDPKFSMHNDKKINRTGNKRIAASVNKSVHYSKLFQ